ncbi:hypothetical protein [Vallitalea guaymasensis]|uniref:hypothetical protein n=1 Tax=Vallitalea guaymasensis TaxID=1185412 RepID=UPI000DE20E90|nr:hypothetical protein [Vallitalea guaymasensis]
MTDFIGDRGIDEYKTRINKSLEYISSIKKVDIIYRYRVIEGLYSHETITYLKDNICYSTGEIIESYLLEVGNEYYNMLHSNKEIFK